MILLADSGSTKTDWWFVRGTRRLAAFRSPGLNPYFLDPDQIRALVMESMPEGFRQYRPEEIYFYGAGCSTAEKQERVRRALQALFPDTERTEVGSDLLGAARALFGRDRGIACILGTGSNAAVYDGQELAHAVPSLGYLLGDEGSGASIGKSFLTRWMRGQVPDDLSVDFTRTHAGTPRSILSDLYAESHPNRYLASFAVFLHRRMAHPFVRELVAGSFNDFLREQVSRLPDREGLPLAFTGSVAFHFRHILAECSVKAGLQFLRAEASPMEGLHRHHGGRSGC